MQRYDKGVLKLGSKFFFAAEKVLSRRPGIATNLIVMAVKNS